MHYIVVIELESPEECTCKIMVTLHFFNFAIYITIKLKFNY